MRVFNYESIDSTNDRAKQLAQRFPGQRFVVTAKRQTAGRGRSGRRWRSPAGGVWLSLAWPVNALLQRATPVSVWMGWAVLQTLRNALGAGHRLEIKWPNDVLLEGKKVAGVLCEQMLPDHGVHGPVFIVGVGINANLDVAELGTPLRYPATTVESVIGRPVDLSALTDQCIQQVVAILETSEHDQDLKPSVLHEIEAHLAWINRSVTLRIGDRTVTGVCRGLDPVGRLRLVVDGQAETYDTGEAEQLSLVGL